MSQGALVLPVTGVFGGVTEQGYIQAATDAIASKNSGSGAPTNGAGGVPFLGQNWLNTTSAQYRIWAVYDAAQWLQVGVLDSTNHLWLPPIGGGNGTIASAGTCDIGAVNEAAIFVSGTTTITAFGSSGKSGWIKFLTFLGVLTLTHNGTSLILPTAANIATVAGDMAIMLYLGGGNWKCVGYFRQDGKPVASSAVTSLDNLTHLGVNAVADATTKINAVTNRALITAVPAASGGDGDIIFRLAKELSTDVAGHQFEQGATVFAQAGLIGFNDYYVRVTPDNGVNWFNGLTVDSADGAIALPLVKYADEKRVDKGTVGTGTVTFNVHSAKTQRLAVSGALAVAFTGWPASGVLGSMFLELVNGGAAAITWAAAINFIYSTGALSNTPPRSFQAAGTDWIEFWSRDGGTTIFARIVGNNEAGLASPAFTGNPTAATQGAGNNSTRLATTAFVTTAVANAVAALGPSDVTPPNVGVIGSYALVRVVSGANHLPGAVISAGIIAGYASVSGGISGTPTGSWLVMGYFNAISVDQISLCVRVS